MKVRTHLMKLHDKAAEGMRYLVKLPWYDRAFFQVYNGTERNRHAMSLQDFITCNKTDYKTKEQYQEIIAVTKRVKSFLGHA